MKIIHFADLHLGVEAYGHVDAATGLSSRFLDFLRSFDEMVDYAIDKQADLVLFCGDAYKSRDPSQTQQREFARRIKKISACGIPVFLLVGNHDLPNAAGRASTTEIFDTLAIENVHVAGKPGLYRIPTKSGETQIVALPWLKRANVLAGEDAQSLDFAGLNARMQEILSNLVAELSGGLDPALPAVLAAHVWVQGARTGSEDTMSIGQEHMLLPSAVALPCFDYVALGHIHRHQVLNENPPVIYAGSLERLDFGDEDDEKGFYVAEIEHTQARRWTAFEFRSVAARRFLKLKMEIEPGDAEPTETVIAALKQSQAETRGSIVRVEISLAREMENKLDETKIRAAASGAYYFSITKNYRGRSSPRLEGMSVESLLPAEALKKYLELKSSEYPQAERLVQAGRSVIGGEG
jgi:DNA repair protein SbcD/Mre11